MASELTEQGPRTLHAGGESKFRTAAISAAAISAERIAAASISAAGIGTDTICCRSSVAACISNLHRLKCGLSNRLQARGIDSSYFRFNGLNPARNRS